MKSPCYNCKYKITCGSPREGHECKGRETKGRNKNERLSAANTVARLDQKSKRR